MEMRSRYIVGGALTLLLFGGTAALLRAGIFGFAMFAAVPLLLGAISAWVFQPVSAGGAAGTGARTVAAASLLLVMFRMDGIICVLMALPLVLPLGALGGLMYHFARRSARAMRGATMLLLLPPATLVWDMNAKPPVYEVHTEMVVAASPEEVWKKLVAFSPMPEPKEWIFHTGIAYPKRARIAGTGVGAVRYCEFSTGPFVEPIEVWDEPRLLRFRVTENPAPLEEWSPYGELETRHLHGYLVSKQGEFRLTKLADGKTLLAGTTWYQHGLWPAEYWRWWSDAIIHRIHLRVLNHVRMEAEQESSRRAEEVSRETGR